MPRARNIGALRDRITFQVQNKTATDIGGFTFTWEDVFSTWADVQEARGDRELRFGQLAFNTMYEIKVRYRNGDSDEPLTSYRIVYKGQNLTIHSIIEKHESYIKLMAYSTDK